MSSMAPAPGPYPVAPKKKTSPIVWILVGIAGFLLLAGIVVIAGGLYLAKKVADNPALVAATAIAATNPDVEVVSSDSGRGTVTFREKSSGKTVTLDLDQIKQGKLSFSEDGKEVTVEAGEGGVRIKGSDGQTMEFGATLNKLPDWLPGYPGATVQGTMVTKGGAEEGATAGFTTKDPADRVLKFYEENLKSSGMKITHQTTHQEEGKLSGVLSAESQDGKRQVMVSASSEGSDTNVGLTFSSKK